MIFETDETYPQVPQINADYKDGMTRQTKQTKERRPPADYIIFALDVPGLEAARPYVETLSGRVGMFKVGLELFVREGPTVVEYVRRKSGAAVFLDLKLHDIPETVRRTVAAMAGLGVAYTTVHCAGGRRMLEAAVAGGGGRVGILAVTVLTSEGPAPGQGAGKGLSDLSRQVVRRAQAAQAAGCAGVICSGLEAAAVRGAAGAQFKIVTPGIRPAGSGGDDQRRIVTPAEAVAAGADHIVVGRPIRDAADPTTAARRIADQIAAVLPQENMKR